MIKLGLGNNHVPRLGVSLNSITEAGVGGGVSIVNNGVLAPFVTFTRASTGTYFDSAGVMRTAAVDEPRIDYDPATLELRGLLVEEQRTNLLLRSQEFDNVSWLVSTGTATKTANTDVAPDEFDITDPDNPVPVRPTAFREVHGWAGWASKQF